MIEELICSKDYYIFSFQNYNKSRIHSYRGARDVDITLDGVTIFRGEIARACGGILGGMEAFGDVSKHTITSYRFYIHFLFMKVLCAFSTGSLCLSNKSHSYFYIQSRFHDIT
jgi:hypothetical protein